jgi:citrate lyase subunit beta/citryl-CoA lyase
MYGHDSRPIEPTGLPRRKLCPDKIRLGDGVSAVHDGPAWLFAPANAPRKVLGALSSDADVVVLDLEDAVLPSEKLAARGDIAELVAVGRRGLIFVRVNACETPLCLGDIEAAVAAGADGIMLPKAESQSHADCVNWTLAQLDAKYGRPTPTKLVPLVETAVGVADLASVKWGTRVTRVAFGSVDFAVDLGLSGPLAAPALAHAQHSLVMASRLAGLEPPIDGVTLDARNAETCLQDSTLARGIGFGGKLAIHPAQIAPIQQAFRPTAEELAWAQEISDAFDIAKATNAAAVLVRGRLVDLPVVLQAQRLLRQASG